MRWSDYKKNIKALDQTELEQMELVAMLIARRKEMGISQRELANRSGLHQAAIARLESEGAVPRLDTLEKVAKGLGLKLALVDEDAATKEFATY